MSLEAPLVAELPLQPGRKEVRYAQLLSGLPEPDTGEPDAMHTAAGGRVEELEQAVASLRAEVVDLRREFDDFKRQFQ